MEKINERIEAAALEVAKAEAIIDGFMKAYSEYIGEEMSLEDADNAIRLLLVLQDQIKASKAAVCDIGIAKAGCERNYRQYFVENDDGIGRCAP